MSVTGQALSSEEAEKLVEKFDKNKDGQLNLEEFKMLCANQGKGKGFKGVFRAKPTKFKSEVREIPVPEDVALLAKLY